MSMASFWCLVVNFEHISHLYSSVSIVNFEHVIAGCEELLPCEFLVFVKSLPFCKQKMNCK